MPLAFKQEDFLVFSLIAKNVHNQIHLKLISDLTNTVPNYLTKIRDAPWL